ncbi:hypothetical protein [Gordonia sp. NPDC058843]|uniref:hypothetical protein n=1 Tax=Gordonia sp. NPDC058843 TaxID=3346648 RepID=UPI003694B333
MTDTVADPAVTPTSAQAEVTVSAAVAEAVRAELGDRGIPETAEIVLFDLDPQAGVSVGRMDPARGTVTDSYSDSGLTLGALDQVIADHLVRVGRVAAPTSREWHEEVLDLVARGRDRLRESDGTFLMGRDHIRLFRMARRDVAEAGAPLTARAEDLARAAVSGAAAAAVVITDRVSAWPGLRDAVARAVPVPVVDVDPSGNATRPPSNGGHAEPDVPHSTVPPERIVEPEPSLADQVAAPDPSPDAVPSDTPIFEAVNESPPMVATAFGALTPHAVAPYGVGEQPLRDEPPTDDRRPGGHPTYARERTGPHASPPRPTPPLTPQEPPPGPALSGSWNVNVIPASEYPTAGSLVAGSLPPSAESVTGPHAVGSPRRRRGGKRVLAVVALLCAAAVVAVATALAVAHDESTPAVAAPPPQRTAATPEPEFADPAILAEARQPARRYTPPPPPETSASVESAPRPRPRPRTPRPQRGVTIPNPIPGLPPIVLP